MGNERNDVASVYEPQAGWGRPRRLASAVFAARHVIKHCVTLGSKLKVKKNPGALWSYTAKRSMAIFAGYRVISQAFRPLAASLDGSCRSLEQARCLHRVLQTNERQYVRPGTYGARRQYSSDAKSGDDLCVRYLDGEDSGIYWCTSTTWLRNVRCTTLL